MPVKYGRRSNVGQNKYEHACHHKGYEEDIRKVFGLVPFNHSQAVASLVDYVLMVIFPIAYVACFSYIYTSSEGLPIIQHCRTICATVHFIFIQLGLQLFSWSYILNVSKRQFYINFNSALDDIRQELVRCNLKVMNNGEIKHRKSKIASGAIVVLFFAAALAFDAYNMYGMLGIEFPLLAITYSFPIWAGGLVQMQFIGFTNVIAEHFEILNEVLELICGECDRQKNYKYKLFDVQSDFIQKSMLRKLEEVKKPKEEEAEEDEGPRNTERFLVDVFRIHNKLYQVGVMTNRFYALQIVCYMTVTFVIIVFAIFLETKVIFVIGGLNMYLDYMAHTYAFWAMCLSVVAYIVLRLCCRVQREAKRSALLVHEIMQRKPAFMLGNDIYYNRMKCFTLQYLHWENYFFFNGLGLFRLDYTFIFSAISAATSYLIVLLQFDLTADVVESYFKKII